MYVRIVKKGGGNMDARKIVVLIKDGEEEYINDYSEQDKSIWIMCGSIEKAIEELGKLDGKR